MFRFIMLSDCNCNEIEDVHTNNVYVKTIDLESEPEGVYGIQVIMSDKTEFNFTSDLDSSELRTGETRGVNIKEIVISFLELYCQYQGDEQFNEDDLAKKLSDLKKLIEEVKH